METKKLVILFIGFLFVTACTREVVVTPTGEEAQEKVPVSIRFALDGAAKTKSGDWKYDEYFPGITPEEQKVTNILLVAFKNTILEEYAYYEEEEFKEDENDSSIIILGKEDEDLLDLEPGPHYFYAFMNLPADLYTTAMSLLQDREGELTKDEFEKKILSVSLDYLTGEEECFIMTNTTAPEVRGIYSLEQIELSNGALHNNITIQVGRAVGKISFAYVADQVQTGELHGSLSDISYKILNNPTQMYLMPVFQNEALITPHYNYTTYPAGYFTPWIKDANVMDDTAASPWLPATTSASDTEHLAYGYCIENSNSQPLKSTSTMLLIQATFTPTVWVDQDGTVSGTNPDGTKGTPSVDGTFYRIGHYSGTGFLYAYLQGYYNEHPTEVLKELGRPSSTQGGGEYRADEYLQGKTYYGFWPVNDNGLHQTKRNNYFKIAITQVHGAGYKDPGDTVDPDIDPEDQATRGRLAVNIESWIDEKVIVILGEEPTENDDSILDPDIKDWEDEEEQEETLDGNNNFN
ncbi:MAG: Mfa1 family fimbria major subunit [Tannerellaceae bacterium]|nr:Mfa1 family fimbria major subunit [Tannerellaceae bacterium]